RARAPSPALQMAIQRGCGEAGHAHVDARVVVAGHAQHGHQRIPEHAIAETADQLERCRERAPRGPAGRGRAPAPFAAADREALPGIECIGADIGTEAHACLVVLSRVGRGCPAGTGDGVVAEQAPLYRVRCGTRVGKRVLSVAAHHAALAGARRASMRAKCLATVAGSRPRTDSRAAYRVAARLVPTVLPNATAAATKPSSSSSALRAPASGCAMCSCAAA